jgi:hypothetical protein
MLGPGDRIPGKPVVKLKEHQTDSYAPAYEPDSPAHKSASRPQPRASGV